MKPITFSERFIYNTAKIERSSGSSGTGFLFYFSNNEMIIPVLITNKHVVNHNQNEFVKFFYI